MLENPELKESICENEVISKLDSLLADTEIASKGVSDFPSAYLALADLNLLLPSFPDRTYEILNNFEKAQSRPGVVSRLLGRLAISPKKPVVSYDFVSNTSESGFTYKWGYMCHLCLEKRQYDGSIMIDEVIYEIPSKNSIYDLRFESVYDMHPTAEDVFRIVLVGDKIKVFSISMDLEHGQQFRDFRLIDENETSNQLADLDKLLQRFDSTDKDKS